MSDQQTPADIAADRGWRNCARRADFASAAEHERDCPAHGIDAQPADNPPHGCDECEAAPGEPCRDYNCQGTWH